MQPDCRNFLSKHMDVMVNHVLEVSAEAEMTMYPLPTLEQ